MRRRRARKTRGGRNYSLYCTISAGSLKVCDVPCKVFLPDRRTGRPQIHLRPNAKQFSDLSFIPGRRLGLRGTVADTTIESLILYVDSRVQKGLDVEIPDQYVIKCRPRDLSITITFEAAPAKRSTRAIFWLTPNSWLQPYASTLMNYDGSITVEQHERITATLASGQVVTFEQHFEYLDASESVLRRPSLVAEMDVDFPPTDTARVSALVDSTLDDLLLLISFASRTRTACVGWQAYDAASAVTHYRKHIAVPRGTSTDALGYSLIGERDRATLFASAHETFSGLPNKDATRWALYMATPTGRRRSTEWRFLSAFSGIEHLLLDFRRRAGLERVVRSGAWDKIRKRLAHAIEQEEQLSPEQAAWIVKKLPELNRVPIKDALQRFCRDYTVDLSDLWPLFDADTDLIQIRNWLVHAEAIPDDLFEEMLFAAMNVGWILERMLLAILKWPLDRSGADRGGISYYYAARNWPEAKDRLATWARSRPRS